MKNKTAGIIIAYVLGQVTQLIIHGMVLNNNMYAYRQIPFCIAAGFVILFALIAGVALANRTIEKEEKEDKAYWEKYAEIPDSTKTKGGLHAKAKELTSK